MTANAEHLDSELPSFGELSPAQCEAVLRLHSVGRLAFTLHDRVNVLPVHYAYAGGWLYGRSAPGGKLLQILRNRWVAFEIDEHEGLFDWKSVVVHGALYVIEPTRSAHERAVYDRAVQLLRGLIPETLDIGDPVPFRNQLFRIHAAEITGRYSVSRGGFALPLSDSRSEDMADATEDSTLRDRIIAAATPLVHADGSSLHVEVYDGVVVLGGAVGDPRDRTAIEDRVVQLPGLHALVQQIETRSSSGAVLGPAEIAMKALRSLRSAPLPAATNVTVVVDHGWLRAEGTVPSAQVKEEIRRRVENIPGVRGFVDRTRITPDAQSAAAPPGAAQDVAISRKEETCTPLDCSLRESSSP